MTSLNVNHIAEHARSRLVTVGLETLLLDVAQRLSGPRINIVVVCNADGTMAGVIGRTDIARRIGSCAGSACTTLAADLMSRNAHHCRPREPLSEVLK